MPQFCCPGGVLLSGKGHTPFLNLSASTPLSWHVVHTVPRLASRCACAEHQSGPPALQLLPSAWLEPELGVVYTDAPSFHIIDHAIYHTDLDRPELVPEPGLEAAVRAFAKIVDEVNTVDLNGLIPVAKPKSLP